MLFARQHELKPSSNLMLNISLLWEDVPDGSTVGGKSIVCPRILIPTAILAIELFKEGRVYDVKFVWADTNNRPCREAQKLVR